MPHCCLRHAAAARLSDAVPTPSAIQVIRLFGVLFGTTIVLMSARLAAEDQRLDRFLTDLAEVGYSNIEEVEPPEGSSAPLFTATGPYDRPVTITLNPNTGDIVIFDGPPGAGDRHRRRD